MVFMAAEHRMSLDDELARYKTHQNDPSDERYRAFLSRLMTPLLAVLNFGSMGLDYGAGPGPTLSVMLEEKGFPTAIYDPQFAPDKTVLRRTYDFITCTETAEHFFYPIQEFDRMDLLLRPGGWFAVMTEIRTDDQILSDWTYARDETHVCFYHVKTMAWISNHYNWQMQSPCDNVFFFQKQYA